ncbi:MAG TPA: 2-amino-4-hydroxy-6-hydroxymethyldihydropteridine diphosphokinase [Woeseiaceae bacterium]
MARIYLGVGSNIQPVRNLRLAITELRRRFDNLETSTVYRNAPVGFEGQDFLNLVVRATTDLPPVDVLRALDDIHDLAGRQRISVGLTARELDIDLLLYDQVQVDTDDLQLPRSDVLDYDFVLRPLAELAPDYVHPITGKRLDLHWQQFPGSVRLLQRECIDFDA